MVRGHAHPDRAQPSSELTADLTAPERPVEIRGLAQHPDPVRPRPAGRGHYSQDSCTAPEQELPTLRIHVPSPPGPGRAFGRLDRAGRGKFPGAISAWR